MIRYSLLYRFAQTIFEISNLKFEIRNKGLLNFSSASIPAASPRLPPSLAVH